MILQNGRDQVLRKAGDDDSEMSAESATSDSGRGGSEEDINSNRGNPMSDTGMSLIQCFSSDIHRAHRLCLYHQMYFDKPRHLNKEDGNGEWDNNLTNDKKYMFHHIPCRNMVFWFYSPRILSTVSGVTTV